MATDAWGNEPYNPLGYASPSKFRNVFNQGSATTGKVYPKDKQQDWYEALLGSAYNNYDEYRQLQQNQQSIDDMNKYRMDSLAMQRQQQEAQEKYWEGQTQFWGDKAAGFGQEMLTDIAKEDMLKGKFPLSSLGKMMPDGQTVPNLLNSANDTYQSAVQLVNPDYQSPLNSYLRPEVLQGTEAEYAAGLMSRPPSMPGAIQNYTPKLFDPYVVDPTITATPGVGVAGDPVGSNITSALEAPVSSSTPTIGGLPDTRTAFGPNATAMADGSVVNDAGSIYSGVGGGNVNAPGVGGLSLNSAFSDIPALNLTGMSSAFPNTGNLFNVSASSDAGMINNFSAQAPQFAEDASLNYITENGTALVAENTIGTAAGDMASKTMLQGIGQSLGSVGTGLVAAGVGIAVSYGVNWALTGLGVDPGMASVAASALGGAASGALMGAMYGSVGGPIGAVIGFAVGLVVGMIGQICGSWLCGATDKYVGMTFTEKLAMEELKSYGKENEPRYLRFYVSRGPELIAAIEAQEKNLGQFYGQLRTTLIEPVVKMVESGQMGAAFLLYKRITLNLSCKYLPELTIPGSLEDEDVEAYASAC